MFYTNIIFCCIGVGNKLFASLAHWLLLRLHARKGPSLSETMPKAGQSWEVKTKKTSTNEIGSSGIDSVNEFHPPLLSGPQFLGQRNPAR